jgi:pimeloyl-ACP methyl ester carboxylesterase
VLRTFKHSPYPLTEKLASTFFEVNDNGRRGHNSPRGGLLWEDTTYSNNRVLLAMPEDFKGHRHPTLIVFLHGNQSILERDVWERQQVPAQVIAANINAFLVAPQFALDALDSNSGNFAEKRYFTKFVKETAAQASEWQDNKRLEYQLKHAPIIIVAYSGGYLAAANILEKGGVSSRVKGVILLDALYGQEAVFAKWLRFNHRKSFFFSAYTEPARASNELVQNMLRDKHIKFEMGMPEFLLKNSITFMQLNETTVHKDLLTQAWSNEPLADLLHKTKFTKPKR